MPFWFTRIIYDWLLNCCRFVIFCSVVVHDVVVGNFVLDGQPKVLEMQSILSRFVSTFFCSKLESSSRVACQELLTICLTLSILFPTSAKLYEQRCSQEVYFEIRQLFICPSRASSRKQNSCRTSEQIVSRCLNVAKEMTTLLNNKPSIHLHMEGRVDGASAAFVHRYAERSAITRVSTTVNCHGVMPDWHKEPNGAVGGRRRELCLVNVIYIPSSTMTVER